MTVIEGELAGKVAVAHRPSSTAFGAVRRRGTWSRPVSHEIPLLAAVYVLYTLTRANGAGLDRTQIAPD
jgi:hypothetical protein